MKGLRAIATGVPKAVGVTLAVAAICPVLAGDVVAAGAGGEAGATSPRSPVNQVFQFVQSGSALRGAERAEYDRPTPVAYLWIPEQCRRLRGLAIFCWNVTEHTLVGHPAIREACAANDLGIFWCVPSFFSENTQEFNQTVDLLQQLLDGLARTSGYEEVATVPWLPVAESFHIRMARILLEEAPRRCLAAIFVKNSHYSHKNFETPVLTTQGAAQEWFQDTADIRSRWQDLRFYEGILRDRRAHPNWPASVLIEGGSGHFDCTERMARYYGRYIDLAAKARLPRYPGEELKPVDLRSGFLADLPVPGHENDPVRAYAATPPAARSRPWYFDEPSAREAQAMAAINWQAQSQLPVFVDGNGKAAPLDYQGIAGDVPRITGEDGITFRLSGTLLPRIPGRFKNAGEPLAQAPGVPEIEWICGPVTPVGNGRFRIALDRTWPNPACLAVRHRGTDTIRDVVQPGYVKLRENSEGQPQAIHFEPIDDVVVGTKSVALVARSDSGLPVSWFVVAGPAIVCGDHLELTPIPPRSSFPVAVTVAAWQWGRSTEPKVQTALIVTRSFRITAP